MSKIIKSLFYVSVFSLLLCTPRLHADEKGDHYARMKQGWHDIQVVYEQLNQHYVEDIDPYLLIKAGINGMLKKLDPYTVFLEEDGDRRLKMITTGKYGGLGIEIGLRNKKVTVIAPIDDSPAKKAGIQAGDIIEKIDGKALDEWNISKVSDNLRGKIGTDVRLTIQRPGIPGPLEITLTRAEIVLRDISYSGFAEPGVAYLALSGFTDKAPQEVRQAIRKLQQKDEIEAVILDLRGNPGGLLSSAVKIVNIFVEPGELIVSTKGFREKEYKFFTQEQAMLPDVPLSVLVNSGSASASEIVAGALQDLDRAIIIGEPTFGKGLVQKVYTVDKRRDVKLKMTTAKYYIPSGRCIQKQDYSNGNEVILSDSATAGQSHKNKFFTRHRRPFFDKGGIEPDIALKSDSMSYEMMQVIRKNVLFDFTVQFHQQHPEWKNKPELDDSVMKAFDKFLAKKSFYYKSPAGKEMAKLKRTLRENKYSVKALELADELEREIARAQENVFINNKEEIKRYLHLELTEKYFGREGRYRLALKSDKALGKAVRVLKDQEKYKEILAIK